MNGCPACTAHGYNSSTPSCHRSYCSTAPPFHSIRQWSFLYLSFLPASNTSRPRGFRVFHRPGSRIHPKPKKKASRTLQFHTLTVIQVESRRSTILYGEQYRKILALGTRQCTIHLNTKTNFALATNTYMVFLHAVVLQSFSTYRSTDWETLFLFFYSFIVLCCCFGIFRKFSPSRNEINFKKLT